jgi:hypothetical protein
MSCIKCEENPIVTYYRWERANIQLVGCEEHLRGMINRLNDMELAQEVTRVATEVMVRLHEKMDEIVNRKFEPGERKYCVSCAKRIRLELFGSVRIKHLRDL